MESPDWTSVDEGWGRMAVDFATLSEPANCREYVAMHQLLDVGPGDRVLDVACGSGLAVELAALRGATCSGIDASQRLIDVALDRTPSADLRVGDMHALPWADGSFDVVTSFRGIWGTTPDALDEIRRVLIPGGRLGFTVWGHIKASAGAWALSPFLLASQQKVENQASMVALGRPGVGEELLANKEFVEITRSDITSVWEFADPPTYARAVAATGPAFEAIQAVGEGEFIRFAEDVAQGRVREGLPLRATIAIVGYTARKPLSSRSSFASSSPKSERVGFLDAPPASNEAQQLFDDDMNELGFVMNASRIWAYQPIAVSGLFQLMKEVTRLGGLSMRQRGILVTAMASTLGDSYCSLAWGSKLVAESSPEVAAGVLRGSDEGLSESEVALARWARKVTRDPNATGETDVQMLRDVGFSDRQIFAITAYISLRIAFSTVNDALGAQPDPELIDRSSVPIREVVTYGRPPGPTRG